MKKLNISKINAKKQREKEIKTLLKNDLKEFLSKNGESKLLSKQGFIKKKAHDYQILGYDFNLTKEEISNVYMEVINEMGIKTFDYVNDIESNKMLEQFGLKVGDILERGYIFVSKKDKNFNIDTVKGDFLDENKEVTDYFKIENLKLDQFGQYYILLNGKLIQLESIKKISLSGIFIDDTSIFQINKQYDMLYFYKKSNGSSIYKLNKNDYIEYNYCNGKKEKILFLNGVETDFDFKEYDFLEAYNGRKKEKYSEFLVSSKNEIFYCGKNEDTLLPLEYNKEKISMFNKNNVVNTITSNFTIISKYGEYLEKNIENDYKEFITYVGTLIIPDENHKGKMELYNKSNVTNQGMALTIFKKNKEIFSIFNKNIFNNWSCDRSTDENIQSFKYDNFEVINGNKIAGINELNNVFDIYNLDDNGNILNIQSCDSFKDYENKKNK